MTEEKAAASNAEVEATSQGSAMEVEVVAEVAALMDQTAEEVAVTEETEDDAHRHAETTAGEDAQARATVAQEDAEATLQEVIDQKEEEIAATVAEAHLLHALVISAVEEVPPQKAALEVVRVELLKRREEATGLAPDQAPKQEGAEVWRVEKRATKEVPLPELITAKRSTTDLMKSQMAFNKTKILKTRMISRSQ